MDVELPSETEARRRYFEGFTDEELIMAGIAAMDADDIPQAADILAEVNARKEAE